MSQSIPPVLFDFINYSIRFICSYQTAGKSDDEARGAAWNALLQRISMNLELRSAAKPLPVALAQHAERSLGLALGRFGQRLRRVTAELYDGRNQATLDAVGCKVLVELSPRGSLSFRSHHLDPFVAVTQASRRASIGVARYLRRSELRRPGLGS